MKIAVCVKWVPVVARMKFDVETKRIVREGVPNELSAYDALAVQRAVELKASDGADVTVYTMGPANARDGLVQCLALGADRAFHIIDPALAGSDTLATARVLSLALAKEPYDLILFGRNSVDAETGQVGPEVAELLGLPQVTSACKLDLAGDGLVRLERELDDGYEVVECKLPAVVTVAEGIAPETFPGREELRAAREREVPQITASELSSDLSLFGSAGSPTWVSEIRFIESNRAQRLIEDATPDAAAKEVVAFLKERGVLDPSTRAARRKGIAVPSTPRAAGGPGVWVVAEVGPDGVRSVTYELLGAAQPVADAVDGHVVGVLIGGAEIVRYADDLARGGADVVAAAADGALATYNTESYVATLAKAIEASKPYAVLLPSTVNGRDLAARVAARLKLGLTGDCVGLEVDAEGRMAQLKPAFGGNIVAPIYSKTLPNMATVRPGLLDPTEPNPARSADVRRLDVAGAAEPSVRVIEQRHAENADGFDIDNAWAVVCVGKGVGGPERIPELEPLRSLLGAELVCTRDVVEAGWMPKQRQVGLTGRSIAPLLYVGVGVRGDFNHMVGIQRAGTIVGVNSNKRAAIFRVADISVLADWESFLPAFVEALKAEMK